MTTALFCCFPTAAVSEALLVTLTLPATQILQADCGPLKTIRRAQQSLRYSERFAYQVPCPEHCYGCFLRSRQRACDSGSTRDARQACVTLFFKAPPAASEHLDRKPELDGLLQGCRTDGYFELI